MRYKCPHCDNELFVAQCCTQDNEWLFMCYICKLLFDIEELIEHFSSKPLKA